ncbi:uncharacterized protein LOC141849246 [Brevipalpus obovatus]|uniref:uncharacterized protein LOC141849246 n=1 Tax=Brevipalpus obovatus TaxID=246614 RepID=UPI003D9E6BB9
MDFVAKNHRTSTQLSAGFCLVLLVLVFGESYAAPRQQLNCENFMEKIDKWSNELYVITDRLTPIPKTQEEMKDIYCTKSKAASRKLRQHRPCLKAFPSQVLNVIISGARKTLRNVCDTVESREEFVERSQCLQDPVLHNKVVDCQDSYIAQMEYVRDNVTNMDHKIPYTCCYYWETKSCILGLVKSHCPTASLEYTENHMNDLFSETTDLLCNKWEADSVNCKKNLLPIKLSRNAMKSKKSSSFVRPNLEIYTQT